MAGSTNAQKLTFQQTQNEFAKKKIASAIQLLGKALPVTVVSVDNSIVTVRFNLNSTPWTLPMVMVPVFGPEWVRYPIQPGTTGVVFPVDARIGGITGLGSGTASLSTPANLSALVFFPVGSALWSPTYDPNALVLYGPNGVIVRNAAGDGKIIADATHVEMSFGSFSITIDSSGVKINGAAYLDHKHIDVQTGSDETGVVAP